MKDRQLTSLDEKGILADAARQSSELMKRAGIGA
jgi:hypothetical protein